MIDPKKLFRAFYQTLYWFGGNAVFGVFSIILIYFIQKIMKTRESSGVNSKDSTNVSHSKILDTAQKAIDTARNVLSKATENASPNVALSEEVTNLLKGGVVIFFFCSLMGSITIDIIISEELDKAEVPHKLLLKFVLIQMPFVILFSLIIVYLLIVLNVLSKDFLMLNSPYTNFVIEFSLAYCFMYKMYSFAK